MARYKMQPLAQYSSYVMEEVVTSPEAAPEVQEYYGVFFPHRDANEERLKKQASELLKRGELSTVVNGVQLNFRISKNNVICEQGPPFEKQLGYQLSDLALGWRPWVNKIILIDKLAQFEAKTILKYSVKQ